MSTRIVRRLVLPALLLLIAGPVRAEVVAEGGSKHRLAPRPARIAGSLRLRQRRPVVPPQPVGWGNGERLTFEVRIEGVEAARCAISVGAQKRQGRRQVLNIRALGETIPFVSGFYRLREEQISLIDLHRLRPLRTTSTREMGSKRREVATRHGSTTEQQIVKRRGPDHQPSRSRRRRRIRRSHFDPLSALFHLRSQVFRIGQKTTFWMLAGTALYEVQLAVAARERIDSKLGIRTCLRLDGTARRIRDDGQLIPKKPSRRVSLWLTEDPSRLPLRVAGETKLGLVDASISSYDAPVKRLLLRLPRSTFFASTPASSVRK
jgi:hypothetical protein